MHGGGSTPESEAQYAAEVVKLEQSQSKFRIITGALLLVIRK